MGFDNKETENTKRYAIELCNITQEFGRKQVLNQISLSVERGEIFGLLGPSGAGKTTMIKILTGQLKQTGGSAYLLGRDTAKPDSSVSRKTGMMLDNSGLYERLSCYQNLNLFAQIYGIEKSRIDELFKRVGLEEARNLAAMKLSKGMRQRLLLARALLGAPEVLFLDEPTSGLDPGTAAEIHRLIMEQRERGMTVFLTTHNMEEATKLCDHVALLHEGNIVEYGAPEKICLRYNHLNHLKLLLRNGEMVELPNDGTSADTVGMYLKQGLVQTIHSTEPNLETVFMELTGRGIE